MKKILLIALFIFGALFMINRLDLFKKTNTSQSKDPFQAAKAELSMLQEQDLAVATFAGGCFWCMEGPLESIEGVKGVVVGYMGGEIENPQYQQVASGQTKHREVAQVYYDPEVTEYYELIDTYWRFIDPTDAGGQFADRGPHYRVGVYYHTDEQKKIAEEYIREKEQSGRYDKPIVVEVLSEKPFYVAEDYHQDFYKHSAERYKNYYKGSGREDYVESNSN